MSREDKVAGLTGCVPVWVGLLRCASVLNHRRPNERERARVRGKSVFCPASYHLSLSPSAALCRPALQMLPKMWKVLFVHLSLAVVSSPLPSSHLGKDRRVAFLRTRHILVPFYGTTTVDHFPSRLLPGRIPVSGRALFRFKSRRQSSPDTESPKVRSCWNFHY